MKKLSSAGILVLSTALYLTSCNQGQSPSANSSPSGSDLSIRIGEVGSLTGNDAAFGESTHKGILLAVNETNSSGGIGGRKIELITLDDQGKASEAVLAMTKLVQGQRVRGVLGEVASTRSIAMAPIAQQYQVPMITPSSLNLKVTRVGDFIFRVCFVDRYQAQVMADFANQDLKAKRVALLTDINSDYSRDSAEYFAEFFKKTGGTIVARQSYTSGDIDFHSQLTQIRGEKPDVILVPGYYTEVGLIARQAKVLGITAPLLGGDGWDSPSLHEIGGAGIEGSYYVGHFSVGDPSPKVQKFVENFKKAYSVVPNSLAALGYDSARLLIEAIEKIKNQKKVASGVELRKVLAQTKDFEGVTGKISLDTERNALKPAIVFQVGPNGNLKPIRKFDPK